MIKTVIKNFSSRLLNVVIQFLLIIIINHILSTEARGEYSAIVTWGLAFFTIFYLSVNIGILRYNYLNQDNTETIEKIEWIILITPLILGVASILFAIIFHSIFTGMFKNINFSNYIIVLCAIPFLMYNFYLQSYMQIRSNFLHLNILLFLPSLITLLLILVIYLCGEISVYYVCIAYSLGQAIGIIPALLKFSFKSIFKLNRTVFLNILRISLSIHIATIITFIINKFDVLLVNYFSGNFDTGTYFLASSIVGFVVILPSALQSVLYNKLSVAGTGFSELKILQICRFTMFGIFLLVAMIYFLIKPMVLLLGGVQYKDAELYLYILLPVCFLNTLGITLSSYWNLIGIYKTINYFSIVLMIFSIGINLFLIPHYGPVGASVTFLISSFLSFIFHIYLSLKYLRVKNVFDLFIPNRSDMTLIFKN